MRTILVTGGAGFIGSNFIRYWKTNHPEGRIINIDALTYAGNRDNLKDLEGKPGYRFVKGDICDRQLVKALFEEEGIDTVVHFAAESHVDRSILGPEAFVKTNLQGTFVLIEVARLKWTDPGRARFIHVSTDEVYGTLGPKDAPFTEESNYAPNSPYSASKAGSDHLVRSYFHTFSLPAIITNCSNNYGPYQFPEKLLPLMIINGLEGRKLPVYGDGMNIRDWLYVEDHCRALDLVMHHGSPGEQYNIGGRSERTNLEVVQTICDTLDRLSPAGYSRRKLISFVKDRPGHDRRYAMDAGKLREELGWAPAYSFEEALERTIRWYMENRSWWEKLRDREYRAYYQKQYNQR